MNNQRPVIFDDDNPEWTAEDFAKAKPLSAFPELEAALTRKPGRPKGSVKEGRKQLVSLRLDQDIVEGFRATGAGWQSRINEALRVSMRSANSGKIQGIKRGTRKGHKDVA